MLYSAKRLDEDEDISVRMSTSLDASSRFFNTRVIRSVRSLSFFFSFYGIYLHSETYGGKQNGLNIVHRRTWILLRPQL